MSVARMRASDGREQSVREHSLNVSRLSEIAGTRCGFPATARLIGLIHDMGKYCQRFTDYVRHQVLHPDKPLPKSFSPHTPTGAIFAWRRWYNGSSFQRICAQIIVMVVRGHHGGLIDCFDPNGFSPLMQTLDRDTEEICYDEAVDCFSREIRPPPELDELFAEACAEMTAFLRRLPERGRERAFNCGLLARLLLGILVDADRHDAACFERGEDPFEAEKSSVDWEDLLERLNEHLKGFKGISQIDKLRKSVSDDCLSRAGESGRLYRLTVPTGGGKTLSSLRFAIARALGSRLYRMFYVIPFNTILDQNAKDIREALGGFDGILEHHGNLVFDSEDEYREHTLLTERWRQPLILTSMVQFLNSLFRRENTYARRMPSLARSVIIFDEIQALPPKCTRLFEMAIRFLTEFLDCTVVLCTATQPSFDIDATEMVSNPADLVTRLDRTRFIDETNPERTLEQAACGVVALQRKYSAVLAIVNKRAQAAFIFEEAKKSLPEGVLIVHMSTNMCAQHRMDALDRVKKALYDHKSVLCVSTSLIEAGINISFPCVVRFYAGLPSILQSAGRCNRHGELPSGQKGDVYIWKIANERIDKLPHVAIGQFCCDYPMYLHQQGMRLDSPEVIKAYFDKERYELISQLSYPYDNTTLVSLLSTNQKSWKAAYATINKPKYNLELCQAFQTAGGEFHAIDENTRSIVVPYNKAISLLEQLNSRHTIKEEYAILRKLQVYTVNVYSSKFRQLSDLGALYQAGETGVIALRGEFYDEKTGLKQLPEEMPLYDF